MDIKIKLLSPLGKIPAYATPGASACDVCAALEAPLTIPAGEIRLIPTGFALDGAPADVTILLFARSGLAVKHGIALANSVGVVDADYRGEVKVGLINHSSVDYVVEPGERIAQMMFVPILRPQLTQTTELSETERGAGGFGHTGR